MIDQQHAYAEDPPNEAGQAVARLDEPDYIARQFDALDGGQAAPPAANDAEPQGRERTPAQVKAARMLRPGKRPRVKADKSGGVQASLPLRASVEPNTRYIKRVVASHAARESDLAALLMLAVYTCADGTVQMDSKTLAELIGVARSTAVDALSSLIEQRAIKVAVKGVGRASTVYRIILPPLDNEK